MLVSSYPNSTGGIHNERTPVQRPTQIQKRNWNTKKKVEADERTVVQRSRYFVTPPRMSSWPLLNNLQLLLCCSGRLLNFYSSACGQLMAQWCRCNHALTSGRYLKHSWTLTFNTLFCHKFFLLIVVRITNISHRVHCFKKSEHHYAAEVKWRRFL